MSISVSRESMLLIVLITGAFCFSGAAEARASTISTWDVTLDPSTGRSEATFEIPAARLMRHGLERRDASHPDEAVVAPAAWRAREPELREHFQDHVHISNNSQTCTPTSSGELDAIERNGEVWLRWRVERRCELPLGQVSFVNASLTRSRFGFHHLGTIRVGQKVHRHVFDATHPVLRLDYSETFTTTAASNKKVFGVPWVIILSLVGISSLLLCVWGWRKRR